MSGATVALLGALPAVAAAIAAARPQPTLALGHTVPAPVERMLRARGFEPGLGHLPGRALALRRADPGLVHAFGLADAALAVGWRRRTARPVVLSWPGTPTRADLASRRGRLCITQDVLGHGVVVLAEHEEAAYALERWLGLPATVLDAVADPSACAALYTALTTRQGAPR